MVNADRGSDCIEMGALAVEKPEARGTPDLSLCPGASEDGTTMYKLTIQIEKVRPKPGPKSRKYNLSAATTKKDETPKDETSKDETPKDETPKDETPKDETPKDAEMEIFAEKSIVRREPAVCLICNETFQSAQSLYLHKKKHHRFVCQICDAYCSTRVICERHEKLHLSNDPNLPHKCHLCPQKFDTKRNVRLHTRIMHSFVPPPAMGKITPSRDNSSRIKSSNVKQIVQSADRTLDHDARERGPIRRNDGKSAKNHGDLTFTCGVCRRDFSTVEAAEAHTREHLELVDKELRCNICQRVFNNETILNVHLSQHLSRALRCPHCPKAFINRSTLRTHMRSHPQDK